MTGHQDPGYDREHSFASFVHGRQLSIFAFSSLSGRQNLTVRFRSEHPDGISAPLQTWLSKRKQIRARPDVPEINFRPQDDNVVLELHAASGI